jgi:hypothetical protein
VAFFRMDADQKKRGDFPPCKRSFFP